MADLSDVFEPDSGDDRRKMLTSLSELFVGDADRYRREREEEIERNRALNFGPLGWAAWVSSGRRATFEQVDEALKKAVAEVSSETVTVVGYLRVVRRVEELLREGLTNTTQTGNVEDSREAAPEVTEEPETP